MDSGNKAPNLQFQASGGQQVTFGENQIIKMSGEQEQNPGEVLQQLPLAVSKYEPSLFVKEQVAVNQIVYVN